MTICFVWVESGRFTAERYQRGENWGLNHSQTKFVQHNDELGKISKQKMESAVVCLTLSERKKERRKKDKEREKERE